MKSKGVLILSVVANVLLAAHVISRGNSSTSPVTDKAEKPKTVTNTVVKTKTVTNETTLPREFVQLDWAAVESEDFKKYIANLRAIKCPEETIKDIIIADVNRLYASKWKALRQPTKEIKYWEPWDSMAEYYDQTLRTQKRQLEQERKALVQELLGVDIDQESRKYALAFTGNDREEVLMGFLEEGKRTQVMDIRAKSREQVQAIQEKAKGGRITPEDQAEIIKIRQWEVAEMKKTMTPQEFEQYVMRVSATANNIRSQLVGFGPNEQEFVSIFRAQTWYNDQFNTKVMKGTPEEMQARGIAQQQMDEMVKKALGDQRFQEYQRSKDYEYRELVRFTQQNELPMQAAATVYDVQKAAMAAMAQINGNANLTLEQKQDAISKISAESRSALGKVMNEDSIKNYENGRGFWLRQGRR